MEKAGNAQGGDRQKSAPKWASPCNQLWMRIRGKRRPRYLQRMQDHEGNRAAGEPGRKCMTKFMDNHESQPRESNERDNEQDLKKSLHLLELASYAARQRAFPCVT